MDYTDLFSHTSVAEATAPAADAPTPTPVFSDAESAPVQFGSPADR